MEESGECAPEEDACLSYSFAGCNGTVCVKRECVSRERVCVERESVCVERECVERESVCVERERVCRERECVCRERVCVEREIALMPGGGGCLCLLLRGRVQR